MASLSYSPFLFLLFLLSLPCIIDSARLHHYPPHTNFLQCLSQNSEHSSSISNLIYTPQNSSYSSVLHFTLQDLRFNTSSTPKPLVIVTPTSVSHIQSVISCCRKHGLQLRIRSGGHDYEGLSYVSAVPFVVLDMINMRDIKVDVANNNAWVQAGASLGELYYKITQISRNLAFPAGVCPSVGIGGHISGGGYGPLLRKYGIAADQVIDAQLIDVNGRLMDRASMGEDVFWAIRGGGGNTFGVVIAWKVNLVSVPSTVTLFTVPRTLEQNAIKIVHRWQYVANKLPDELYILSVMGKTNASEVGSDSVKATFFGLFLGGINQLLPLMQERFPELGLVKEDCSEMGWAESILNIAGFPANTSLDNLLTRTLLKARTKSKSDYVKEAIPEDALERLWKRFYEVDDLGFMYMVPYGGRMSQVPESSVPFAHRAGYLYKIGYFATWNEDTNRASQRHINWIRKLYSRMTPYVSKNPRGAYINYRDLDIGVNNVLGQTSYAKASIWGKKYYGDNFDRLVRVKTAIDPTNFFRNEQSIPPLL
ncbi:hypothetical protein K2173_000505 [Erythroxylum novogranatense]|uniref:FAD-binding PCMH-type domain-containing protein n=1 Tax=Erythroxylum novogranatense TaxID=1862640 RepID=A0AAV8SXM6_9ROSI|nr:hypothetical protein K2173_000505 [Erythroxylum novogranatense]